MRTSASMAATHVGASCPTLPLLDFRGCNSKTCELEVVGADSHRCPSHSAAHKSQWQRLPCHAFHCWQNWET